MSTSSSEFNIPRGDVYQLTQLIAQCMRDQDAASIVTVAAATYSATEPIRSILVNYAGTSTLTLAAAAACPGRSVLVTTITANAVVSASSNVIPLAGGAAGTSILSATAGKYALLQSDGTSWRIRLAN